MACNCVGGENCCRSRPYVAPVPGPFKCPDCGAWWTGYSHICLTSGSGGDWSICTCPKGNYVGDIICPRHYPGSTATGTVTTSW